MMRYLFLLVFPLCFCGKIFAQDNGSLTVEKIMKDERWMGISPSAVQWDITGKTVYFTWNPDKEAHAVTYQVSVDRHQPVKTSDAVGGTLQRRQISFSRDRLKMIFENGGDIILADVKTGKETNITNTSERESDPVFNKDESKIIFRKENNLYCFSVAAGILTQLTNFTPSLKPAQQPSEQDKWLQEKQAGTFDVLRSRNEDEAWANRVQQLQKRKFPRAFYVDEQNAVKEISISPDMRFIAFNIEQRVKPSRSIIVPDYVTNSGYTEPISGRTKVGSSVSTFKSYVYDTVRDSIYAIATQNIPGIRELPAYLKDYPERYQKLQAANKDREVSITGFWWNANGTHLVTNILSQDHKDRWIMKLDPLNGTLSPLDRQHDEAWIGGPGITGMVNMGWVNDQTFYYQSEASGYTHIYTADVGNGTKKQLTTGNYEVQTLRLSNDRQNFYFTANIQHPGIYHYYRISADGKGKPEKLTTMDGINEALLSPDEKWLAIRYSYIDKPWELYLQKNEPGAKPVKVTQSTTPEFAAYKWKIPETISFKNRHGTDVYAQVFQPANPDPNRPAVVFVHSNGYLQNVNYGWSYHYREYMFNNMLVDQGYTVINIDYTASSGYGRDFRTGIYRHMGGVDLTDLADGAKLLVEKYKVNPARIGLYGGSYGGFLTLMAMFTESDIFKSGAALRSVADWSNYNPRYTSNILNDPIDDEKAYKQSSPLYFADGLKGHLLMTHGIVDVNVNFQDIIEVSQRLIELRKENWELAVYPKEDHNFVDPVSWTDQYRRILKLFNSTLKEK